MFSFAKGFSIEKQSACLVDEKIEYGEILRYFAIEDN